MGVLFCGGQPIQGEQSHLKEVANRGSTGNSERCYAGGAE
jgi:hypothetical protein